MKLSVGQPTLLPLTLAEELDVLRQTDATGIGLFQQEKIPAGVEKSHSDQLRAAGLKTTVCIPTTSSIFRTELFGGATDPDERVRDFCSDIDRLAVYEPAVCVVVSGPLEAQNLTEANKIVANALWQMAEHAAKVGTVLALEPIHEDMAALSYVTDVEQAAAILRDVAHPNARLLLDIWHVGDSPATLEAIRRNADLLAPGMHVNDRRDPTRSFADRALPGEGILDLARFFATLRECEWDGWLDLEILSDDGRFEQAFPDSLWKQDPLDVVRRGLAGITRAWEGAGIAQAT